LDPELSKMIGLIDDDFLDNVNEQFVDEMFEDQSILKK